MINVIKASGASEPYSERKVRNSMRRAGVPKELEEEVLNHVKSKLFDNITTREIYHHIIEYLIESPDSQDAAKYNLKQGIMDLGPTGYPFEDYVSEILKSQGYKTSVRQVLRGKCVFHEIDVVAEKDGEKLMVEAKYHNGGGTRSDLHVSLYTKARFDDLKAKHNFSRAWIVTNTKVTEDALAYALCEGVKVIGWNYPKDESLNDLVEKTKLYPITSATSLSKAQKQSLMLEGTVLCKNICVNPALIKVLGLNPDHEKKVLDELNYLCKISS